MYACLFYTGFDMEGYDDEGYDRQGYNRLGYDREGFNQTGYSQIGEYDGIIDYNMDGYDPEGFNRSVFNLKSRYKALTPTVDKYILSFTVSTDVCFCLQSRLQLSWIQP